METCTKVNGLTIRPMAMAFIRTLMGQSMKGIGLMISNMGLDSSAGLMARPTKVCTSKAKSMAMEGSPGLTKAPTLENSIITTLKAKAFTSGLMAEFLMATGAIIRCKATERLRGQTDANTSDNTSMI